MQYALPYRHIAGLGGYYHHGNGSRGNRGMPVVFAAGGAAARGEHRAGQGCPFFGIKFKSLHIHLVAIHKQHDFIGDNIILGSPRGAQYSSAVSVAMQQVRKP